MTSVRVALPTHLRTLSKVPGEVVVNVGHPATIRSVLEALEGSYPMLRGTIRDHGGTRRRPFIRFFACERDMSHESQDTELPSEVQDGKEPFYVVGAIAGG